MKRIFVPFSMVLLLTAGLTVSSCKNKAKENTTTTTTNIDTGYTAPVEVSTDDALRRGVTDATKDFPGVSATVNNGEVTLTGGPVSRDRLPVLMGAINSLNPKKVNNNLTIN